MNKGRDMRGVKVAQSGKGKTGCRVPRGWPGKTAKVRLQRALNARMGSHNFICWAMRHHQRSKRGLDRAVPQKDYSGGAAWCNPKGSRKP